MLGEILAVLYRNSKLPNTYYGEFYSILEKTITKTHLGIGKTQKAKDIILCGDMLYATSTRLVVLFAVPEKQGSL